MSYIQKVKKRAKVIIPIAVLIPIIFYSFTPKYPTISKDESLENIEKFLKETLRDEARNHSFEALNNKNQRISVELENALKEFEIQLSSCKNDKVCLIEKYENFMDDWTSDTLTKRTRAKFMINKFGTIGHSINKEFGLLY